MCIFCVAHVFVTRAEKEPAALVPILAGLIPGLGFFVNRFTDSEAILWMALLSPPLLFFVSMIYYLWKSRSAHRQLAAVNCLGGVLMTYLWSVVFFRFPLVAGA